MICNLTPDEVEDFMASVQSKGRLSRHPLLIPSMLCEEDLRFYAGRSQRCGSNINRLEISLGFFKGEISAGISAQQEITEQLGQFRQELFLIRAELAVLSDSMVIILASATSMLKAFDDFQSEISSEKENLENETSILRENISFLIGLAERYKSIDVVNNMRAQLLLAQVGGLIQQRDTSANIQLASQTKTMAERSHLEALAMKSISIVTMLFLPATFVATFFSMSVFDWQASTGDFVSDRIWIYFAITIPLTALVFAIWRFWHTLKKRTVTGAKGDEEKGINTTDEEDGLEMSSRWSGSVTRDINTVSRAATSLFDTNVGVPAR
jgi:Mg2+ and Co2+ transporter CorA